MLTRDMTGSHHPLHHGGDLDAAAAGYDIARADWLDLSTGINPVAYPVDQLEASIWARLPEAAATAALIDAARDCYGAPPDAGVVAAPGTQALIQWLPRLRPPARVSVFGPTYAEHAHCWRAAGHAVEERAAEAGWDVTADVSVLVQPNNPDGHVFAAEELLDQAVRGGWLVVDEAFADAQPEVSVAGAAGAPGLIILRSFGKFFGLAGMRLGFALTDTSLAGTLAAAVGPWAVGGPALEIGRRALGDATWIAATRARLKADAARLDEVLIGAGLEVIGGTPLFRLARSSDRALHEELAVRGIWTRAFGAHPDWVRFGLPNGDTGFRRLAEALRASA